MGSRAGKTAGNKPYHIDKAAHPIPEDAVEASKEEVKKEVQNETPNTSGDKPVKDKKLEAAAARRRARRPGFKRRRLDFDTRPGYIRRVVNDTGNRIEQFRERGWEVVMDEDARPGDGNIDAGVDTQVGSPVSRAVGQAKEANTNAVLMEIPKEWYDEDQQAKQDEIDRREKARLKNPNANDGGYGGDVQMERY